MTTSFYKIGEFLNYVNSNSLMGANCPVQVDYCSNYGDHHYKMEGIRDTALSNDAIVSMIVKIENFTPSSPEQETNVKYLHKWLCERLEWTPTLLGHTQP